MTEQAIFDRVKALIDENAALKAANADQADKLKLAQNRIAELEKCAVLDFPEIEKHCAVVVDKYGNLQTVDIRRWAPFEVGDTE